MAKAVGTPMAKIQPAATAPGCDHGLAAALWEARPASTRTPAMHATTLIRSATLAPPNQSTQPWIFRMSGSRIDLLADRTRALPVNDPQDRELTIRCGCALMNLRVTGASQGFRVDVALLPDRAAPDWLASYLNPPIQVAELRPRLRDLAGRRFPQRLLRLAACRSIPP